MNQEDIKLQNYNKQVEVLEGEVKYPFQNDFYSFGMVYYEVLIECVLILIPNGATLQNLTFWMIETLEGHTSFIQSLLLTKIVVLDSNSNLVFVIKILVQSKDVIKISHVL